MPTELWAKIFLHTQDAENGEDILDDHAFKVYNSDEPGYVIATVCRTWQGIIVHGCPSLWANFCVKIGPSTRTHAHLEGPVPMVLARSREHSLDVRFKVDANGDDVDVGSLLELILNEFPHWQMATLCLVTHHLPLLACQRAYPEFKYCNIVLLHTVTELPGDLPEDIRVFESATILTNFTTLGFRASTSVVVPFSELRVFEDKHESITVEILDGIVSRLPFTNHLT